MPAYRCSLCGINYPTVGQFSSCPVCEEKTSWFSDLNPHADWKERTEAVHDRSQDEVLGIFDLGDAAIVVVDQGELFLPAQAAYRAGLRSAFKAGMLFSLLVMGNRLTYEVQGWDEARRRWWVRVFDTEWPTNADGHAYAPEEWLT